MANLATAATRTSTPLSPIRIEVGGVGSPSFKSIDHVVWEDVPAFAVLTGLNGSGKTQLLEFLAHRLTETPHRENIDLTSIRLDITGDVFPPDSVAYIPSRWDFHGSPALGLGELHNAKRQLHSEINQNRDHDMRRNVKRARILRLLGLQTPKQIHVDAFVERPPTTSHSCSTSPTSRLVSLMSF